MDGLLHWGELTESWICRCLRALESRLKNQTFGEIEWTGREWRGSIVLPCFRDAGECIDLTEADRKALPLDGSLPIQIETGGVRRGPSAAQAAAWEEILNREPSLCDEMVDALIAEYRIQRPNRVRYWRTLHGNRMLNKSLPANVDAEIMKQLVLPLWCKVQEPDRQHGIVDCYITMTATWWSEALNVYIRNGKIVEITALGAFMNRKLPWIDVAPFGKLRRRAESGEPWVGEIRLDAFQPFAAVAVDRTLWDSSYSRSHEATSDLPWAVSRGAASIWVYGDAERGPTDRQCRTFDEFARRSSSFVPEIMSTLFDHYRRNAKTFRKLHRGAEADLLCPVLKQEEGLRDLTELADVNVFSDDGKSSIALGFVFQGTWTGEGGVGVRWCNGRIEEVGTRAVAVPHG